MALEDHFGSNEWLVDRMRRRYLDAPGYPFPCQQLSDGLDAHTDAEELSAQEDPENMGAWHLASRRAGIETGITRALSASPAAGKSGMHVAAQQDLVKRALS